MSEINEDIRDNGNTDRPTPSKEDTKLASRPQEEEEAEYPPQHTVIVIMFAIFLATFLVSLDRTIIATAIPVITDHFNSLNDVGWYASAYLLTMCGTQLLIGRIYTFYNPKWVFLAFVSVFELGSLICAVAPSSKALIIGRAVAGIGSAGNFSGAITLIFHTVPLRKRPAYTGLFGAVFGVSSVAGPLMGGAFTDRISWRWCFYINLPIGGITIAVISLVLKIKTEKKEKLTLMQKINQLDPIGTVLFIPSIICILLALQWGGTEYAWSSARIIVLIVLFAVLFVAFVAVQLWKKETATVPPHILTNRSVAAGTLYSFCNGGGMQTMVYFLPIWFQAIKGASAVKSGIMNTPMILGMVISSILVGFLTRKIGYYTPWMYVSSVMTPIGAGLISTFTTGTGHNKWIGYQVLYGVGLGFGMQQPSVAAQTVLAKRDVPTGAALMFFAQALGGALCVSIANNIFDNKLLQGLQKIPGVHPGIVTNVGATDLRNVVPPSMLPAILTVYNAALRNAFYVGVAVTSTTVVGTAFMEWKSIKKGGKDGRDNAAAATSPPSTTESGAGLQEKQEEQL